MFFGLDVVRVGIGSNYVGLDVDGLEVVRDGCSWNRSGQR